MTSTEKQITTSTGSDSPDPLIRALEREERKGRLKRPGKSPAEHNNGH